MENAIATIGTELSVTEVSAQVAKIQDLMRTIMHEGEHYGNVPGTGKDRKSLFKPGAEKLCFVFRLAPEFSVERDDLPNGHREYRVTCKLRSMASGVIVGEGLGSCSTMESKYRYRENSDFEVLDEPIPEDSKERKAEYRKRGFGMKKVDGVWCWVRYTSSEKVENPDIADVYNTVLKMAKKRAHIDATITACAASDIFTQDVGDDSDDQAEGIEGRPTVEKKLAQPARRPQASQGQKPPAATGGEKAPTRGQLFNAELSYAKLTQDEATKAVYTVVDAFVYPTIGNAINLIDEEAFKRVIAAIKAAGEKKRIDRAIDAEAQEAAASAVPAEIF